MKPWIGIVAGMGVLASSTAMASSWWLIFTGGEKPNRIFVAVDEAFLSAVPLAEKTYRLETLTVIEEAKSPDWVSSTMIVDCGKGTLEEKLIQVSPRGGKLTTAPDQPPHPPKNIVGEQMLKFACEMGPKPDAERVAVRKVDSLPQGWMYLGDITTSDITDLAWNSMWTDNKRPAVAARSKEELDREIASLEARRKQALDTANAIADQTIEQEKKEQKRFAEHQDVIDRADARQSRETKEVRRGLGAWLGHSEHELVSSWGPPTNFEDKGSQRILHYSKTAVELGPDPSQGCGPGFIPGIPPGNGPNGQPQGVQCIPAPGGGAKREEINHQCTASFEFRDGKLIDYFTNGGPASCRYIFGKG
jgi:hypothetical protein